MEAVISSDQDEELCLSDNPNRDTAGDERPTDRPLENDGSA